MAGTIDIVGKNLVFDISGADKFLALKGKFVIPLSHVTSVSTEKQWWWTGIKIAGARIPSVVKDGRFISKGKLLFYMMHDPTKCITINLNNERYSAIIFQVQNKTAMAKKIMSKIKR